MLEILIKSRNYIKNYEECWNYVNTSAITKSSNVNSWWNHLVPVYSAFDCKSKGEMNFNIKTCDVANIREHLYSYLQVLQYIPGIVPILLTVPLTK